MSSNLRAELAANDRMPRASRQGFTIIELLVTLAVMAVLAAMTVFAMGPLQDRSSVSGGASLLQTWLNTARQRAIRDKNTSGIRFLPGSTLPSQQSANPYYVTQMVYLEGGTEVFGTLSFMPNPPTNPTINPPTTTFTLSITLPTSPPFSSSDTIVINSGLPHQILVAPGGGSTVTIAGIWPYAIPPQSALPFRIIRGPTALTGASVSADSENILTMPRGSCINFNPQTVSTLYPGSPPGTNNIDFGNFGATGVVASYVPTSPSPFDNTNGLDVMFAPDGTVTSPAGNNPIAFWISGTNVVVAGGNPQIEAMHGNPGLVVLYPRTGQVAGYNVGTDQINVNGTFKANAMKDVQ